jgi:hypothetical protein
MLCVLWLFTVLRIEFQVVGVACVATYYEGGDRLSQPPPISVGYVEFVVQVR